MWDVGIDGDVDVIGGEIGDEDEPIPTVLFHFSRNSLGRSQDESSRKSGPKGYTILLRNSQPQYVIPAGSTAYNQHATLRSQSVRIRIPPRGKSDTYRSRRHKSIGSELELLVRESERERTGLIP